MFSFLWEGCYWTCHGFSSAYDSWGHMQPKEGTTSLCSMWGVKASCFQCWTRDIEKFPVRWWEGLKKWIEFEFQLNSVVEHNGHVTRHYRQCPILRQQQVYARLVSEPHKKLCEKDLSIPQQRQKENQRYKTSTKTTQQTNKTPNVPTVTANPMRLWPNRANAQLTR